MSRGLPKALVDLSNLPTTAPVPTEGQRIMFLEAVMRGASMHVAAHAAGLAYTSFFRLKLADPMFAQELELARDLARPEALEELAVQFATQGVPHETVKRTSTPIVIEGTPLTDLAGDPITAVEETVTSGREFGTHSLLQFILKGQMREKYGTEHAKVDTTLTPGAPPAVRTNADAQRLLAQMRAELRPAIEGTATEVKHDDGSDLV